MVAVAHKLHLSDFGLRGMNVLIVVITLLSFLAPSVDAAIMTSEVFGISDDPNDVCLQDRLVYTCTVPDVLAWTVGGVQLGAYASGPDAVVGTPQDDLRLPGVVANLTEVDGTTLTSTLTISSAGSVANESMIICAGVGQDRNTTVLRHRAPPAAPGTPSVFFSTPRMEFNVTWAEPPLNANETVDAYFVNISGPNDLCGTSNTLPNVSERSYTCTIQTVPQEGDTYTIRVAAANCGGNLRGPLSAPAIIQVPYAPTSITFGPDCPDLQFVNVFWQNPVGNSMTMPTINEVCVVYCTGDNCTSSDCRSVSDNNPFVINNITNGTSYNISVSLRNDFGESGQTTALYGNTDDRCVTTPTPTPTPTPTRTPTRTPTPTPTPSTSASQTPTQPPTQTQPSTTTGTPVSGGSSTGAIAGGVIAGIIGASLIILIIIVIAYLCWRKKNSPRRTDEDIKLELNKNERTNAPAQNTQELQVDPEYEEVDTLQSQTIQLEENVAYGPVKQSQNIELKENVAYGPVKRN